MFTASKKLTQVTNFVIQVNFLLLVLQLHAKQILIIFFPFLRLVFILSLEKNYLQSDKIKLAEIKKLEITLFFQNILCWLDLFLISV